jgi:integrase
VYQRTLRRDELIRGAAASGRGGHTDRLAEGAARAKIPIITPHALRHTFGTRWLQVGGDIYKLSKILGQSSVAVTEAHYAHLLKEDLVAASQQVRIPVAPRGEGGNVVRMPGRRRSQA